jgi:hypothetical protein
MWRLAKYEFAGDLVVNGSYDPEKRWVIGFDDLVGAHGGFGGPQTKPFLIYPSEWTDEPPNLVGSVQVHQFLKQHTSDEAVADAAEAVSEQPQEICAAAERVARRAERPEQPADDVA